MTQIKVGDIIKDDLNQYGIVTKVEQHFLVKDNNQIVYVYYVLLFSNEMTNVYFFEDQVNKVE